MSLYSLTSGVGLLDAALELENLRTGIETGLLDPRDFRVRDMIRTACKQGMGAYLRVRRDLRVASIRGRVDELRTNMDETLSRETIP